jgi:hypothetical protein
MLPFLMFSSPPTSPTNRSPRVHPLSSTHCHPEHREGSAFRSSPLRALSVSALSSRAVCPFNFQLPSDNCPRLSPFPATLTNESQLTENPATLSPVLAILTSRVKHNPFVCHSYKKHPGWGVHPSSQVFSFCNLTTLHSVLSAISFRIRTSAKRACNSHRIRTSKTQDLKPFRIRTYEKTPGGRGPYHPRVLLETPTPVGASLSMYVQERPGGPGTQVLTMRRFLIAIASLAVLPAIASAQGRGMMSGMARPAMAAPAPHVAMHASQPAPAGARVSGGSQAVAGYPRFVRTRSGAVVARPAPRVGTPIRNHASGSGGSGRPLHSQDDIVPGLGFDYPHVAATHPHGIHDRDRDRGFSGGFFPFFFGGGFDVPLFPGDVEEAPPAEAQAVDNGDRAPEPVQTAGRPADYEPRQSRPPAAQPVAEPESEPYVFVRRDGTVFFATAYAWENGTLRYITAEGLRRTVTADKLDLNATQQFNEQRGLSFRLPV